MEAGNYALELIAPRRFPRVSVCLRGGAIGTHSAEEQVFVSEEVEIISHQRGP
jgi:hypothetical protein